MGLHGLLLGIPLLFHMWVMFVPHWKHLYGPLRQVTFDNFAFSYVDDVRTSLEAHVVTVKMKFLLCRCPLCPRSICLQTLPPLPPLPPLG
jgi:hypothetical protein